MRIRCLVLGMSYVVMYVVNVLVEMEGEGFWGLVWVFIDLRLVG